MNGNVLILLFGSVPWEPEVFLQMLWCFWLTLADAFPSSSTTVAEWAWRSGLQTSSTRCNSSSQAGLGTSGGGEAAAYLPANFRAASSVWSRMETLPGKSWLMSKGNSIIPVSPRGSNVFRGTTPNAAPPLFSVTDSSATLAAIGCTRSR